MSNPRTQRWLAVGLLLLVIATVVFVVVLPLVNMGMAYHEEKNDLLFRLQRQQTIAGRQQLVSEALETIKQQFQEQGYFSTSSTEALVSAELQNIVKTAVSVAGGQLTSSQGVPGVQQKAFCGLATVSAFVIPILKNALSESRAKSARIDKNRFLDRGLHLNQSFA